MLSGYAGGTVLSKSLVVFGSSKSTEGGEDWAAAEAVGRIAAQKGFDLWSGGYQGAMGAASRGARSVGGHVVGVTTPIFTDREPSGSLVEIREEADYPARLAALLRAGDAFVALPGGLGTASEILAAWCLASIGELGGPLYCFVDPWRPIVASVAELKEVGPAAARLPRWLETPAELERLL
jgi:uncharacterized protein (TIGR00730 family)